MSRRPLTRRLLLGATVSWAASPGLALSSGLDRTAALQWIRKARARTETLRANAVKLRNQHLVRLSEIRSASTGSPDLHRAFMVAAGSDTAAIRQMDQQATAAKAPLRFANGLHTIASATELSAPFVVFDPGAVLQGNAALAIHGRIVAERERIFTFPETSSGGLVRIRSAQVIFPEWFGATGQGDPREGADDSGAIQLACDSLSDGAGGVIQGAQGRTYPTRFVICVVGDKVILDFSKSEILSDQGRAGRPYAGMWVQIGNSRESNLALIRQRRLAGDFKQGVENPQFADVQAYLYPEADSFGATSRDCAVLLQSGRFFDDIRSIGCYGVHFSNTVRGYARIDRARNASQCFGFGSDVVPRTPYAIDCVIDVGTIERPNINGSYYSVGFFGYAVRCTSFGGRVLQGVLDGARDGNLAATNLARDCLLDGASGECGRGANGQGYLFGRYSARCYVTRSSVSNAKQGFATDIENVHSMADSCAYLDCSAVDVDILSYAASGYTIFDNVRGQKVKTDLMLTGQLARNNIFHSIDHARIKFRWGYEALFFSENVMLD